jgi:ribosomal protein S18 acetylase RimI-like enzyme
MFTCEDWRAEPAAVIRPLIEAEADRWRAELDWDVTEAWRTIEPSRADGRLAGFVLRDDFSRVAGWTCFLVHGDMLQVAMFVAETAGAATALVDAIRRSPLATRASIAVVCCRGGAPGLASALERAGFATARYRYLSAPVRPAAAVDVPFRLRPWHMGDVEPFVTLCARAYEDASDLRAFAPRGLDAEWIDYVRGLLATSACGRFRPDLSVMADLDDTRRLAGAVFASELAPGTAHLAQVAVDPSARGRGLGTALVARAMAEAASRGFTQATLLVATGNRRAASIYERLGFRDRAAFVVAVCDQPRRLTSVALETGGASTRR